MKRDELKRPYFTQVTDTGEIPRLDDWVKALKRFGLSNAKKKIMLPPPQVYRERRSAQQNRTVMGFWLSDIILPEFGYEEADKERVFGDLKMEMGWTVDRVNKKTGEVRKFPASTRDCKTEEYSRFMEKFQRHMAINHNIILPDPEKAMAVI